MESGKIYQMLKEKIIGLDLMPESFLNITELAKSHGVSRTPIKEALIMLESDGWVLRDGSHFMVTPLSLNRIKEITEIRSVMEVQGNIWAMYRINKEELTAIGQLKKRILQLDSKASNRQMVELDIKFHRILFKATKNNQLATMLDRLLSNYLRFWLSIPLEIEPKSFFTSTLEIIKAINTKDEIRLRTASADHIRDSVDAIIGSF